MMAKKLSGRGGALRRWPLLFLFSAIMGVAAVRADSGEAVESVWGGDGKLKRGKCVVAIKTESENPTARSTSPTALKNTNRDERERDFHMVCGAKPSDQSALQSCQSTAEKSCVNGLYVYEVPEENKDVLQVTLGKWTTPNIVLFINCLKRDPDLKTSSTGKYQKDSKCQGGREMQFQRSLVNSYPRIVVNLLGDKSRIRTDPWYNDYNVARDLAQAAVLIKWTKSVLVECNTVSAAGLSVSGIAASPVMCPPLNIQETKLPGEDPFVYMSGACTITKIPGSDIASHLFFDEVKTNKPTYKKGLLTLQEDEMIVATPLLHQEIYPFLGAFQPRSGPFFESPKRYHVILKDSSRFFSTIKQIKPEKSPNPDLITWECHCGTDKTELHKCLNAPFRESSPVYVSSRMTDQLKWSIYEILERELPSSVKTRYRFILEGPWQPHMVFHPEGSLKYFKRIRIWWRAVRGFFGRKPPSLSPDLLILNPELFYSYRDLRPSIVMHRDKKGTSHLCYGKFQLRFNSRHWKMVGSWGHPDDPQSADVFPKRENQKVLFVHDLVTSQFSRPNRKKLAARPVWSSREAYNKIELSINPVQPKDPKDATIWWMCEGWEEAETSENAEIFHFVNREVINLRSTLIF